jgi:hypothetical protein
VNAVKPGDANVAPDAWMAGIESAEFKALGSRLIKSTIRARLQDRQTPSNFGPTCRTVWRYA